jgi:hypothetical protein
VVVFQQKDHWQIEDCRQIQRLLKDAVIAGPITEKADQHLVDSLDFNPHTGAGCDGNATADEYYSFLQF